MHEELEAIACGSKGSADLPAFLNVWDLLGPYGELRSKAFDGLVEWGGCIVYCGGALSIPHPVRGTKDSVGPSAECQAAKHPGCFAGFLHVHLNDDELGGAYPGFSGADYRAMMVSGIRLALVTNGPEVFALVRPGPARRQLVSDRECLMWRQMYHERIEEGKRSGTIGAKLWEANQEMCRKLGLAFYRGLWGKPLVCMFSPD